MMPDTVATRARLRIDARNLSMAQRATLAAMQDGLWESPAAIHLRLRYFGWLDASTRQPRWPGRTLQVLVNMGYAYKATAVIDGPLPDHTVSTYVGVVYRLTAHGAALQKVLLRSGEVDRG